MSTNDPYPRLPSVLTWLLERFCHPDFVEEFQGDLEEMYAIRLHELSAPLAKLRTWLDGLSLLRVHFRRHRSTHTVLFPFSMFKNYFLVAIRSLRQHAAFASINIAGLAVSMAVGLILILFIRQAGMQDEFHDNSDRIIRVYSDFKASFNRNNDLYGTTPASLSDLMEQEIPGVERAAHIRSGFRGTLVYEGTGLPLDGLYADPDLFDIFSFELSAGDPATALVNPGSLILSPSEVTKFFGDEDPLGKVMVVSGGREFTVTGVLAKDDYHTIFPLGAIASYSTLEADSTSAADLGTWWQSIYRSYTFALLEENANVEAIQGRVRSLIPVHFAETGENKLHDLVVQPLQDISLGVMMGNELGAALPGGAAWFLGALSLMILLTACFNYVGLTVSRSLKRSREVGVRKVFGARRSHISSQFIFETLIVSVVSVLMAILLLQWMVPAFNSFSFVIETGINLTIDYASDGGLYVVFALFTVFVALIAGFYPALFLSRFQPAEAVRGSRDTAGSRGSRLRKSLVVLQFSVSLIFLVVTIVMVRQASFIQNADYGFAQDNMVNVRLFDVPYERFRDRLAGSVNVETVSGTSIVFAQGSRSDIWVSMPGMTEEEATKGYQFRVDERFIDNFDLTLVAGSGLTADMDFESSRKVIVTERTVEVLGLMDAMQAIGQSFIMGDSTRVEIAGVLKDFHADTMMEAISPLVFSRQLDAIQWANIRLVPGRLDAGIQDIVTAWDDMGHARDVDYAIFENQLKDSMVNLIIRDLYRLIGFIAMLAVIIACLGLLGIASFNVERRTREISIRKVMGADASSVIMLLSREFLVLIGISSVISIPLAWLAANAFLQEFAYRVTVGPGTLLLALGALLLLAFSAIGSQTLRATRTNPIDNLYEN